MKRFCALCSQHRGRATLWVLAEISNDYAVLARGVQRQRYTTAMQPRVEGNMQTHAGHVFLTSSGFTLFCCEAGTASIQLGLCGLQQLGHLMVAITWKAHMRPSWERVIALSDLQDETWPSIFSATIHRVKGRSHTDQI